MIKALVNLDRIYKLLCLVSHAQLFVTSWTCSPAGSSVHGILQARILEWVAMLSSRESSQPRGRIQVSHIAGGFFMILATREAKNTRVGSLILLQGQFLTQESNLVILHGRWILYQLSQLGQVGREMGWSKYSISHIILEVSDDRRIIFT